MQEHLHHDILICMDQLEFRHVNCCIQIVIDCNS